MSTWVTIRHCMKMLNNSLVFHPWGDKMLRLCKSIHSIETILSKKLLSYLYSPQNLNIILKIWLNLCKLHGFVIWDLKIPIIIKISLRIPRSPKKGFVVGGRGGEVGLLHVLITFPLNSPSCSLKRSQYHLNFLGMYPIFIFFQNLKKGMRRRYCSIGGPTIPQLLFLFFFYPLTAVPPPPACNVLIIWSDPPIKRHLGFSGQ
jgi:hypothetical protein